MKIKSAILGVAALSSLFVSCKNEAIPSGKVELKTQIDSVSYALGANMGKELKNSPLKKIDLKLFAKGIQDMLNGQEPQIKEQEIMMLMQNYMAKAQDEFMKERQELGKKNLEKGKKFLEENKKKEGVITLPSGIQYKITQEGSGADTVSATSEITVHYHGTTIDGKVFDSSVERKTPFVVQDLTRVIPGWLALQGMKVGTKCTLYLPADKAYGEMGTPSIEPNEVLIFDIEIISVKEK